MQQAINMKVAQDIWKAKAVTINLNQPFTWASGLKMPIYVNNRLFSSYPHLRWQLAHDLGNAIKLHFPEVQGLIGVATAGITHAILAAHYLHLPMGYVRQKAKDHGKLAIVEGGDFVKQKVVVIEDLISTGKSVAKVVANLEANHIEVLGVVAIFSYQLPMVTENLNNLRYYPLTTLDDLLKVGQDQGKFNAHEAKIIKQAVRSKIKE